MNHPERAPVQRDGYRTRNLVYKPPGSVLWAEHCEGWKQYARRFGEDQSAERIAERGGFGYYELTEYLGHNPTTWEPRR